MTPALHSHSVEEPPPTTESAQISWSSQRSALYLGPALTSTLQPTRVVWLRLSAFLRNLERVECWVGLKTIGELFIFESTIELLNGRTNNKLGCVNSAYFLLDVVSCLLPRRKYEKARLLVQDRWCADWWLYWSQLTRCLSSMIGVRVTRDTRRDTLGLTSAEVSPESSGVRKMSTKSAECISALEIRGN